MKKILLFVLFGYTLAINTAKASPETMAYAEIQVSAKDVHKAIFNIISYNESGNIINSGYGVFLSPSGTGIASFSILKGASRADVIDYKGNKYAVHRILGANSTYDLVKFSIEGIKKADCFEISTAAGTIRDGAALNISHYTTDKKAPSKNVTVTRVDDYEGYHYFHISESNTDSNIGCPLFDNEGKLVAFTQKNVEKNAQEVCAIDIRFADKLKINAMATLNADLRATDIPKALPENEKDALTYIYMMKQADSLSTITALNDFIGRFPENAEGYTNRGTFYASKGHYDLCENDYATALQKVSNESSTVKADEVHNELSKLIYQKAVYAPTPAYGNWTLQKALDEAQKAFAVKPAPYYLLQQGRCLFSMKEYMKAYEKFMELNENGKGQSEEEWSSLAKAEAWFYAARSLEMAGGDSLEVITLLDSTITALPRPYTQATGQYFLERAQRLEKAGNYRNAVADYNEYEKAIGPKNLTAQFYYVRSQAEIKARMFQQGLDDIQSAIALAPLEPVYRLEEALILLRAGMYEESIGACERLLQDVPDVSDCYKIMGIAYGELKQKSKARAALNKAKELGDPSADTFLQKYQ